MKRLIPIILFACIFISSAQHAASQQTRDSSPSPKWTAEWSVHPEGPGRDPALFLFRNQLNLTSRPDRFVIHVSADQRYRFFVNGVSVATGPALSDLSHWRYETIDIAPNLKPGVNILSALVWSEANMAPWPQISAHTAFLVQSDSDLEKPANTPGSWKVMHDLSWTPVSRVKREAHNCSAPNERINAALHPWDWMSASFDDSKWANAIAFNDAMPVARGLGDSLWMLTPRNIPLMSEKTDRFATVVRSKRVKLEPEFLSGSAPFVVPPKTKATVLVDREKLLIGYPELTVSGGAGSKIRVTYEESLFKYPEVALGTLIKGNRNDVKKKEVRDNYRFDEFLPDGGAKRVFSPLWWRTVRYLQLDIETGDSPVTIDDLRFVTAAYPFINVGSFDSSDPSLRKIWETGKYTIDISSNELFVDGPFYEEFAYIGDSRIRAIVLDYLYNDDRLTRNTIEQFFFSRIPDGLTQSRATSRFLQIIPTFSLLWISMVHDHWMYHGDAAFTGRFLNGMKEVLDWFDARIMKNGLIGKVPWWNFVDWSWPANGVPPGAEDARGSSIVTLQYVLALRDAADIESALGADYLAKKHHAAADAAVLAVRKTCWDAKRGLLADTPDKKEFSQHATALGVLTGAVPTANAKAAMQRSMKDESIAQCSLYFRHYLHEAADKAGLSDDFVSFLKPWQKALDLGLTTWPETPGECRSDCHAWSATPTSDLQSIVCGVRSDASGFTSVKIAPHPGSLEWVTCDVPHPKGVISVSFKKEKSGFAADIELPSGTPGVFEWKGKTSPLKPGKQKVIF
ncbi:MAG: alpha-L-rhamnosidase C-terminal domain-containing protein [bacterium]